MTNVTPEEEEAWQEYERQVDAARRKSYGSIVADNLKEAELSQMTMLRVFALGYRAAVLDMERKKNE